jgi:hypothetical protein
MSDGALFKPEKDHSKEADKVLPEAHELAKVALSWPWAESMLTISSTMFKKPSTK